MLLPIIYKVDTKGKIRTYQIELDEERYCMITGLESGKKTSSKWTIAKAKNIGRSNATTPVIQAKVEANARYDKKLKEHYHRTRDAAIATPERFFKPMLATEVDKVKSFKDNIDLYVYDPKLDGMRLVVGETFYHSRTGKPVPTAVHIAKALKEFLYENPTVTLDGELYNHTYHDDFNALMSLARRTKPTRADLKVADEKLQYHIYDLYDSNFPDMPALERKQWLLDLFEETPVRSRCIQLVHCCLVSTEAELDILKERNLTDGYEGTIGRLITSKYQHTRTKDLIKIKDFITEEFVINNIVEGKGNRSGIAGAVSVQFGDEEVDCGIRGTHAHAKELLNNKNMYIGKLATVRHFGVTPDLSLRFPVCIDVDREILE